MALADYRLCDVCGSKAFYDSNLNYETSETEWVEFTDLDRARGWKLDHLGDWAVVCADCAKTHECVVVPIGMQATQSADLAAARAEVERLRAFAQDVMEHWPEGAPDGGDLQEYAVKYGLLRGVEMPGPCGENCGCTEYLANDEWPSTCYRRTSLLTGERASDERIAAHAEALREVEAKAVLWDKHSGSFAVLEAMLNAASPLVLNKLKAADAVIDAAMQGDAA